MRRVKKNEKNVKKKNKDEKVPQGRIVNPAVLLILGSQSVLGLLVNCSLVGSLIDPSINPSINIILDRSIDVKVDIARKRLIVGSPDQFSWVWHILAHQNCCCPNLFKNVYYFYIVFRFFLAYIVQWTPAPTDPPITKIRL